MPIDQEQCDHGRIEQFLESRLTADDEALFESHLDVCPTCRERLETTAAGRSYWTEATSHLRDDPLDGELAADSDSFLAPGRSTPTEPFEVLRIADYFDPTDDPRMLGRFGGYEIVGIVGCGGMGVVLKGFESALDRYVAIKVLAPHLATSGAARTRFAREARAAAAVLHENVVAIHRVSEANGLPYLVMPYVPGDSLQKRLDERGPLETAEILRIGMQVAAGLAAAHAQGLVHRDIKPGNILLDNGVERVTITDFGLARAADDASLTRSGVITGTPQYMSPEQARGEPVDGRSDLFSLGSVLYALCTGRPPFRAETAFGVLRRITESTPRPIREIASHVPEWLSEIVAKLHAKRAEDRLQSAGEVAELLGRWLAHIQQPTVVPAPPRLQHEKPHRRRTKLRWIGAAAGTALLAASLAVVASRSLPERPEARPESHSAAPDQRTSAGVEQNVAAVAEPLMSDQALSDEYERIRRQVSALEREWSEFPSGGGSWEPPLSELHRRLGELSDEIDRSSP